MRRFENNYAGRTVTRNMLKIKNNSHDIMNFSAVTRSSNINPYAKYSKIKYVYKIYIS